MASTENLVEVRDLYMYFPVTAGVMRRKIGDVKAVDGVSFDIKKGETLGLVGESGCGKTTTGRSLLQLYKVTSGSVKFEGRELTTMKGEELRAQRQNMQLIFQDPYASLDPRMTAGDIIGEPMQVHHLVSKSDYKQQVDDLLRLVQLEPYMADRYPHEFSGGQRQRLGVARALSVEPEFLVLDEPVSALDVSVQAQVVNLLEDLQRELGLTYLFIAHDLALVEHVSDRVAVMYLGRVVEIADAKRLYREPRHPYTQALLSAVPRPDPAGRESRSRIVLEGDVPSAIDPPSGCPFHPRCPHPGKDEPCRTVRPPLEGAEDGHMAACHHPLSPVQIGT